jgi:hypothetical protein
LVAASWLGIGRAIGAAFLNNGKPKKETSKK